MTIQLECINIIIPISKMVECIGFRAVEEHLSHAEHDDHLCRFGAMDPFSIHCIMEEWEKVGLKPQRKRKGVPYWADLCVVDTFDGPTLPCRWLEFDPERHVVHYLGRR